MGRSRGGLTSKIHAVVDTGGLPVRLGLTAGEAYDNRLALKLLSRLRSGSMLLADRGYDATQSPVTCLLGAEPPVPPRGSPITATRPNGRGQKNILRQAWAPRLFFETIRAGFCFD